MLGCIRISHFWSHFQASISSFVQIIIIIAPISARKLGHPSARHVDLFQEASPYRAVLELSFSIAVEVVVVPGDIMFGIVSTLALPFAVFEVSIIVEQSGII